MAAAYPSTADISSRAWWGFRHDSEWTAKDDWPQGELEIRFMFTVERNRNEHGYSKIFSQGTTGEKDA